MEGSGRNRKNKQEWQLVDELESHLSDELDIELEEHLCPPDQTAGQLNHLTSAVSYFLAVCSTWALAAASSSRVAACAFFSASRASRSANSAASAAACASRADANSAVNWDPAAACPSRSFAMSASSSLPYRSLYFLRAWWPRCDACPGGGSKTAYQQQQQRTC